MINFCTFFLHYLLYYFTISCYNIPVNPKINTMQKITKNDFVRIINNPEVLVTDDFGATALVKNNHILYFKGDEDTEYDLDNGFVLADGGRLFVVLDCGDGSRCEIELVVKAEVEDVMNYA